MLYNTVLCLGYTYLLCPMQYIKMQEIMEMQSTSAMVTLALRTHVVIVTVHHPLGGLYRL